MVERVVIFTGDLAAFSVREGVGELIGRFPSTRWLLIEHRPPRRWARVARNQLRALRREGWRWMPYVLASTLRMFSAKLRGHDAARPNEPGLEYELSSIVNHSSVSFLRTPDIHDEATVDAVRRFDPDVGVCLAAPILKSNIFEIPRLGTINLHKGELPDYRGMPPAFWEIWNGARRVGCSVHQVERALDTGPVLLAATVSVEPFSTVRGLQIKLDQVGVDLIADALEGIANGTAVPKTQVGTGTLHRKPTLAQQAALRVRERKRAPFLWRALAKEIFFALYVRCIRPFPRVTLGLLGRQRVTVLLYHRVSDAIRNSLTVGVEQFEEQMIDVRRRCTVVTIEDIVRGTFSRRSIRPIVAVTFDDGYRDNFEYAAAILLRWRVPAAFFVSTALIDSERGFPHDLVNGGAAIPTMTWKQVKAMKRWGFGIGSHTQTHVNCVKDDPVVVEREIVESKRDLEHRVEQSQCIFAYPYGGREDFNGHWRARVKQAGYIGCLSAYGGCNHAEIEPFNVLRTGISHAFGKWAFRSRLEGWA